MDNQDLFLKEYTELCRKYKLEIQSSDHEGNKCYLFLSELDENNNIEKIEKHYF